MDTLRNKIKVISTIMVVCSLALSVVLIILIFINQIKTLELMNDPQVFYDGSQHFPMSFLQYLQVLAYIFVAYIFLRIRRDPSPFTERLSKQLKALAVVFFLIQCLTTIPYWIVNNMIATFNRLDMSHYLLTMLTALTVSVSIFSLALIFQYGALLQKDTNEIV